jgi:hypothetical protein
MTTLSTMKRMGRAAAMTLILATPALGNAAYAFDAFGGDESAVTKSAQSARYNDPAETPLAKATADAKARMSAMAANPSSSASDASSIGGRADLLGMGGQQDELARAIHHPGTGTDW